jgi:hypothetical protein
MTWPLPYSQLQLHHSNTVDPVLCVCGAPDGGWRRREKTGNRYVVTPNHHDVVRSVQALPGTDPQCLDGDVVPVHPLPRTDPAFLALTRTVS